MYASQPLYHFCSDQESDPCALLSFLPLYRENVISGELHSLISKYCLYRASILLCVIAVNNVMQQKSTVQDLIVTHV